MSERNNLENNANLVELAGLLHDIGKFYQRTEKGSRLAEQDKSLYCPYNKNGYYGYVHAAYTAEFIKNFRDIFPDEVNYEKLMSVSAKHHIASNGTNILENIIKNADWISSGVDRSTKEDEEYDESQAKYYETSLTSVFSTISLKKAQSNKIMNYRLAEYSLSNENIFPVERARTNRDEYKTLWERFIKDLTKLKNLDFKRFLTALDSLLLRYTWSIPAATQSTDNAVVSLYDHSVTTAAFASAIHQFHIDDGSLENVKSINNQDIKKFLFVSGDLSGIQRHIFDLKTTKYSSKLLRAKSYELQLLSNYFAEKILLMAEVSQFCKLTNAGGRFLLVLPNTSRVVNGLKNLRKRVDEFFVKKYFGEISLNISEGVEASQSELKNETIGNLFARIAADVNNAKLHKFQSYLLDNPESHVIKEEYSVIESADAVCEICGKRKSTSRLDGVKICGFCKNQHVLGTKLPKVEYYSFTDTKPDNNTYFKIDSGRFLHFNNQSYWEMPEEQVYSLNKFEPGIPVVYAPFYLPESNGNPLTFENMAKLANGNKKIAMFKADVDNLGAIFSIGFGDNGSISRYATLSRMLDIFFSGYLHTLIKDTYKNIYTVFSGGDDVCVIGPWNEIMKFSVEFNKKFKQYSGGNPSITLSAGISLSSAKLPVKNLAQMAENQLAKSKERKKDNNSKDTILLKNAVTVFDTTVSWDEYDNCLKKGDNVSANIDKVYSKRFVYSILGYIKSKKACEQEGSLKKCDLLWKSHLQYSAARNIHNQEEREDFLTMIEDTIDSGLPIIINYALYQLRGGQDG